MALLVGLEQVLDPVVVLLDNLTPHLQPAITSAEMLDFLATLTGAPLDDTLETAARRELVKAAARIGAARGTRAGLQLALSCVLPNLEPQVLDNGQVRWGVDSERMRAIGEGNDRAGPRGGGPGGVPPEIGDRGVATPAAFDVLVARELSALELEQVERCIADQLPLGTSYRLGIRDRASGNG
jgi:phage tail-like protein